MRLRVLLVLGVIFTGWQLRPVHADGTSRVGNDVHLFRIASRQFDAGGLAGLNRWLRRHPSIRQQVRSGGQGVWLRFADGVTGTIVPSTPRRKPVVYPSFQRHQPPASPGQARALVLEPFATELGLGPSAGDPEVSALQSHGFAVDQLYDTQVTLDSMANWHEYNVIYIETHSGVNPGGEGVVASGQVAQDNDPAMASLLQEGSVLLVHVSGSNLVYYGITSVYIRNHEGNFPGNSIVFLNGCNTLAAPAFWQALQSKGVGSLVSWDQEATTKDNYLSAAAFFAEMSGGLSVSDAVTATKNAGYGTSSVGGTQAELGFVGDGMLTLADAANPPSPKPGATTATPVSHTPPTPIPTAARLPGPPLHVALMSKVAPGTRQIIRISSGPGAMIHIRVDFPTGDSRTANVATDASGRARFAYPQHRNRVAFGRVFATVTIQASLRNGGTTSVVQRYRIGWSRLDLAVLPRQQAVQKFVTVEAHSAARTRITVWMHFPSGAHTKLLATTDRRGWALIRYQVGRYLKTPTKHVVVVNARARVGGVVYRTATTFRII